MIALFSPIRATMRESEYFAALTDWFQDAEGRFKVFKDGEAPTNESPFCTVEILQSEENPLNRWATVTVMFHFWGKDTEWATLYAHANATRDIFQEQNLFSTFSEGVDPIEFHVVGEARFSEGRDPVTELVTVSLGLEFGVVDS